MEQDITEFVKSANLLLQKIESEKNQIIEEYRIALMELMEAEKNDKHIKVCYLDNDVTFPLKNKEWTLMVDNYFYNANFASLSIHFKNWYFTDNKGWSDKPIKSFAWSQCEIVDNPNKKK